MPTRQKRINLTLPKNIAFFIKEISLRDDMPQSKKIVELLDMALEAEEDLYFSVLAEERLKKMKGTVSHKQFWSRVRQ